MQKLNLREIAPYLLSILFFALISYLYFSPDVAQGRVLQQHDMVSGVATSHEANNFLKESGERTRWTNTSFSGMPTYQITPTYAADTLISKVTDLYRLWIPAPLSYLFILLLGFYILLLTLNVKWNIALWGAIAYAFSSYFVIIIGAGHIWKLLVMAYIPPTLAGVMLAYRGRYLSGAAVTALFGMLQLYSNHIQMTYYSLFIIGALCIAYLVEAIRDKELPRFLKATASLVTAALLALGAVSPNLFTTYDFSKETMRGKSPLVMEQEGVQQQPQKGGLTTEYITQWSYGVDETLTLLIPNAKGGASGVLSANPTAMERVPANMRQYMSQLSHYWGDQPFTSGPVYVGALVLFFFILGCFVVKGSIKWGLLAATLLTIMLSWGKNFLPLTQLFIDYVPLYNKFRAVSSLLVVAEITMPLLAALALKEVIAQPQLLKKERVGMGISVALTAGVALLAALVPSLFDSFITTNEGAMMAKTPDYAPLFAAASDARMAIFRADAWRTVAILALGGVALYLFVQRRINSYLLVGIVGVVTLFDLYSVDKRYLNSDHFVPKAQQSNPIPMSAADKAILQDKDPNYKVLNLTVDTYNDPTTSYYHKSIGGYSPAKLRSYQDLIDHQLSKRNPAVLNMLNTKYIIIPDEKGAPKAVRNPDALGNAWFVSQVEWAETPAAEMKALDSFDPQSQAVINQQYKGVLAEKNIAPAAGDTIYLTHYAPNQLTYQATSAKGGLAIFSEIYYPDGWSVTIDGKEAEGIIPANYLLRALHLPAGTHEVVFTFDPTSVKQLEIFSYLSLAMILLLLAVAGYMSVMERR